MRNEINVMGYFKPGELMRMMYHSVSDTDIHMYVCMYVCMYSPAARSVLLCYQHVLTSSVRYQSTDGRTAKWKESEENPKKLNCTVKRFLSS